jgi:acyl-homoserine-lactone acylase
MAENTGRSGGRAVHAYIVVTISALMLALSGCGSDGDNGSVSVTPATVTPQFEATVARTSFGIPHVNAANYKSLGYGIGYAFAQDNFCVLADKVAQVSGERAKYFGETSLAVVGAAAAPSITSLNSDFFYKHQYDKATIAALWAASSVETRDLATGYAAGINRYLSETGVANLPVACRNGAWVRPITEADLFVWWSSIATISGSQSFAQFIADAQAPTVIASGDQKRTQVAKAVTKKVDTKKMLADASRAMATVDPALAGAGSNGWAIGKDATADGRGMLLTNPHWPWTGMNKFYQAHLTIPGEIDVMGVAYPGTPFVLVGFNESVGWTHTVSTGPRFVIRELTLGATPTSYVVDGVTKQMTARTITVERLNAAPVTRTYYSTEFGPIISAAALGITWSATKAFAFTDINLANNRLVEQWIAIGKARTAEAARQAIISVQGVPLINTIIADSTGDAVYVDYSLKPNVSDAKLASCPLAGVGATLTAGGRPTLDGSRSSCNPDNDTTARQPGILPISQLPFLRRTDYVANANNSYWLTNPAQPLAALPLINGAHAADIGFRPRMNLIQIAERLAGTDGLGGNRFTPAAIQAMLIGSPTAPLAGNRGLSGELLMPSVATLCAGPTVVTMADGSTEDVAPACAALNAWDRRFNAESVGTHVFREFFAAASALGASLWSVPFSAADPVNTPRGPNLSSPTVVLGLQRALGTAQRNLAARGIALNRPWGELFFTAARGRNLPTGGGTSAEGVANQMNGAALSTTGYNNVTSGSSYVATMAFGGNGPEVDAVLIPGQSTNPASPYYYDQLESLWSQRRWHRLPFSAAQIAADPNLSRVTVKE